MNLAKYHDIDLPVFDPDIEVLATKDEMEQAAEADDGYKRFVRAVKVIGGKSLNYTLQTADDEFTLIADKCGAEVIDHRWGLWQPTHRGVAYLRFQESNITLPKGYIVVADVEVIQNATALTPEECTEINKGLGQYRKIRIANKRRPRQLDMFSHQFKSGHNPDRKRAKWLLDIEPDLLLF